MNFSWKIVIDAGAIAVAILIATILRAKVRFFQKYLIPNALTAGFLLLPFYNFALPALGYSSNRLGELVYHLLNISFIAMTLRSSPPKIKGHKGGGVLGMAAGILSGYALQALLGLALTLFFLPKLFPAFGLFLPLGFASGPGQSFAIGKGWEAMGFEGASTVGLTVASIGYVWGCFGGIWLINLGRRKGWLEGQGLEALKDRTILTGIVPRDAERLVGARLTTDSDSLDSFSFHTAAVVFTYLLSYLFLRFITWLLHFAGDMGMQLAANLWGLNFIFSAIIAIVMRKLIEAVKLDYLLDDDTLSRITGFSVDFMLAGSVAAISLAFVARYWFPIVLMTSLCGLMTFVVTPWTCSRMFRDNRFERMLMIYGVNTGTLSTGLALLRVTDPEFKTSVASDYMLSAGLTFALAIPFVMTINFPAWAFTRNDMNWYWAEFGVSGLYLLVVLAIYLSLAKKRSFAKPFTLWYKDKE
jgi:ESS family glutamate:Na+ symporter